MFKADDPEWLDGVGHDLAAPGWLTSATYQGVHAALAGLDIQPVRGKKAKPEAAPEPEPQSQYHRVVSGDTLSKIAKQYYGDLSKYPEIFEENQGVAQPDGERLVRVENLLPGQDPFQEVFLRGGQLMTSSAKAPSY